MKRHRAIKRARSHRRKEYCSMRRALGACIILLMITSPVLAENAGDKLAEGVGETATGWVEAPKQIAETTQETNIIEGVTVGAIKGAGETVYKTTEGAVKTATFYVPPYGEEGQQETQQQPQEGQQKE